MCVRVCVCHVYLIVVSCVVFFSFSFFFLSYLVFFCISLISHLSSLSLFSLFVSYTPVHIRLLGLSLFPFVQLCSFGLALVQLGSAW
jgi:hypothetical protein